MSSQYSRRDVLRLGGIGLGGATLAGVLAACSTATSGGTAATAPATSKPTDFSFVSWGMSETATQPVLQASINAFAKQESVKIQTPSYPYNNFLQELTLQVRGGQFAGASQLDVAWLSTLAAQGKLRDLSSLAKGRGYTDAALKAGQSNGKQLGLPWTVAAIGLIANQDLLTKAKVSNSWETLDEFEDALQAIKGLGVIPYAASTKPAQLQDILVWMQTFGSPIIKDGKCTIGDEGSVAAVTWYKKLYDAGLIAPDVDRTAARNLFAQGKTAMYDDAPVGVATVVAASPDKTIASKMVPIARPVQKKGDTPQELLWGHLMVVVDGDGADTAGQFAQWLTSNTQQEVSYFNGLGLPPTTKPALASSYVTGNKFVNDFTAKITKDAAACPLWPYPAFAQMITQIANNVQAVLLGSAKPADAMKAAGAAVNQLIG
jgi:multiple sugar transport system substrate-binding protein